MGERAGQVGRPAPDAGRVEVRRVLDTSTPIRSSGGSAPPDREEMTETAAVRDEIEQTRAEMSETIDAIQGRLDPETLTEQAKDTAQEVADRVITQAKEAVQEVAERAIPQAKAAVQEVTDHAIQQAKAAVGEVTGQARTALREATIGKVENMARNASDTAGSWRHTLVATIKANPIPSALAGLSLGWLYLNRTNEASGGTSGPRPGYQGYQQTGSYRVSSSAPLSSGSGVSAVSERAQDTAGRVADSASRVADRTQQRVGDAVDSVQDTASQVAGTVQETAGQVLESVQDTAGQVAGSVQETATRAQGFLHRQLEENPLAVGAAAVALGATLGASLGTTPHEDRFFGEARDRLLGRAQEATQDTMQKVERVVDEVQSTAKREAKEQSLIPST